MDLLYVVVDPISIDVGPENPSRIWVVEVLRERILEASEASDSCSDVVIRSVVAAATFLRLIGTQGVARGLVTGVSGADGQRIRYARYGSRCSDPALVIRELETFCTKRQQIQ